MKDLTKSCIIIPCYNEAQRLPISELKAFIETNNQFDFLLVNDGSTDQTRTIIDSLSSERITILHLEENLGKALAIREAVLELIARQKYSYVGYFDADLATPLSELKDFSNVMNSDDYLCIFGSRFLRVGGNIKRLMSRHYIGRVFATFASVLLGLPIYDTQCGAKVFHKDILEDCFREKFVTNWTFDIEIFFRIKNKLGRMGFLKQVYELPLKKWTDIEGSKIKFIDCLKLPLDLLKIYFKYK